MDKKDWEFLVVLYRTKNISKAAEVLFISQPALTNRIKRLEQEFGIKIIQRIKKGIEFTIEGEHLVNYSKQMISDYQKTRQHLLSMSNKNAGYIRIGVNNHYALYKLTDALDTFLRIYPEIQIKVKTGISSLVMEYLYEKKIHVAIESGEMQWSDKKVVLCNEDICLISNKPIKLQDLPYIPMIQFKTNKPLQKRINDWWRNNFNTPPLILMEMDSAETCKKMVQHNFGYAIVPKFCLSNQDKLYSQQLFTKDNRKFTRNIYMKYNSASLGLDSVQRFLSFMKNYHE